MAEIKSTMDLVMERTKNMIQSSAERTRAEEEAWRNKAKGYLLRLVEGRLQPGDLPDLFQEMSAKEGGLLNASLVKVLIEALALEGDNQPVLTSLGVLAGEALGPLIWEVQEIIKEFGREKEAAASEAAGKVLEELAAKGITGSALRPKPGLDSVHDQARLELRRDFKARLGRVQADMMEKIG